ncbi:MAG: ATP synthase F1 subunit gamma [Patescibacteria group bacterium]|jgi:F-type H+-transporting ATPase subunit gamma
MPQATRDIKRRIKSVGNTKKVTKAMEMVSAAKMRKSVANVLASRSYASLAGDLIMHLSARTDSKYHPLLRANHGAGKIGLILVTSNRGLCGGFNNQIINQAIKFIKLQHQGEAQVEVVAMGKKGREAMVKTKQNMVADFNKMDITTDMTVIAPLAKLVINDYLAGKYDKVMVAYTDFISALVQKPRILQLLPLSGLAEDKYLGQAGSVNKEITNEPIMKYEYLFEPSADKVLDQLLPRMLETQIYQTILESDAAEHSARMVAMRNATDAASDMIAELTLVFNKARQGSITAELADISGGRAALE